MAEETRQPEWMLISRAFLASLCKRVSVDPLVYADATDETVTNKHFKNTTEARAEYKPVLLERLRLLRRSFGRSFLWLLTASVFALIVLRFFSDPSPSWLGVSSVFFLAWSTLARLGYPGQSMGHGTVIERLDEWTFKVLFWIGTFLGILAMA